MVSPSRSVEIGSNKNMLSPHRFATVSVLEGIDLPNRLKVLSALPDTYRDVIEGREARGLSYSQLAKEFEISEATVRSRLYVARKRVTNLHSVLQKRGDIRQGMTVRVAEKDATTPEVLTLASTEVKEDILGKLTPRERQALLLKEDKGLSYAAVGVEMAITPGTVRVLLRRGRQKFRKAAAWMTVDGHIEEHGALLHNMALETTKNNSDAEDVIQEVHLATALRLSQRPDSIRYACAYLATAVRNRSLNLVQRTKPALSLEKPLFEGDGSALVDRLSDSLPDSDPEKYVLTEEIGKEIVQAIEGIANPEYQQILWDVFIMGKDFNTLSSESGEPKDRLTWRFFRAKPLLRKALCSINPELNRLYS